MTVVAACATVLLVLSGARNAHLRRALADARRGGADGWEGRPQLPPGSDDARHPSHLEAELRRAVGAGELHVHVQPVIDLRTGAVVSGELLCRWTTEDGREIPPDAFIEVAEDSMLVVEIGRWVLDEACRILASWDAEGRTHDLSINLSGRHIEHPDVVEDVLDACERWAVSPSRLVVELTETALVRDLAAAARSLEELRGVGITVCVDDFGVGYASLRYLRELPVQLVKIDKSIVAGLGRSESDSVIISMLTQLASSLEFRIVAEGVETEDQRAMLWDLGCHYAQGYLFARAMPLAAFEDWESGWRREYTHPSVVALDR